MSLNTDPRPQIDLMLSQSDRPAVIQVGNTTIIGEIHIKTRKDTVIENDFLKTLDDSEFIITEHQCSPGDSYSSMGTEKRFMQMAQDHAIEYKKPFLILDNELLDRYKVWLDAGIDISRNDFNLLLGMDLILNDFGKNISQADSLQRVFDLYNQLYKDTDLSQKMATATYLSVFHKSEIENIGEKTQMVIAFVKLDAQAREAFYQNRLIGIQENIGEKKMVVVVGRDHAQPIADSLNSGYISHIDEALTRDLSNSISEMKRRTGFDTIVNF